MREDLDTRARDAATAARNSVAPVADAGAPRAPRPRAHRLFLGGAALAVAVTVALVVPGDDVTTVSTGPAKQPGAPPGTGMPPGKPPGMPPALPALGRGDLFVTPLAEGKATDGRAWAMYIGGPSNDLCLGIELREPDLASGTGMCAGSPYGAPPSDPTRPMVLNDTRSPAFVFGRMPADVTEVTVVLADATLLGRRSVVQASGGPFYVVELPTPKDPTAVIGHRADGSSVRYDR